MTYQSQRSSSEKKWEVLIRGQVKSGVETDTVRDWVLRHKLDLDDMVRLPGQEWSRVREFPELSTFVEERKVNTQKQLNEEYSYYKVLGITLPICAICALPAPLYDPFLETGTQYVSSYLIALIYYLVFGIGMACFMNFRHHQLIQQGNRWGFWRYSRASGVGVVSGIIMLFTGCPPMLPLFLPVVNQILTAMIMVMAITMFFKLIFVKQLQFED